MKGDRIVAGSRLINRNVAAANGRTSIRLEPELWGVLAEIARREGVSIGELVRRVERQPAPAREGGRTSAVRVFLVEYLRAAATEDGHLAAGHGAGGPMRRDLNVCW